MAYKNDINKYDVTRHLKDDEREWLRGVIEHLGNENIEIEKMHYAIYPSRKREDINLSHVYIVGKIGSPYISENDHYHFELLGRLDQLCYTRLDFDRKAFVEQKIEDALAKDELSAIHSACQISDMIDRKVRSVKEILYEHTIDDGRVMIEKASISKEAYENDIRQIKKSFVDHLNQLDRFDRDRNMIAIENISLVEKIDDEYQIKLPNINGEFGYPIEILKLPKDVEIKRGNGRYMIDVGRSRTFDVVTLEASMSGLKPTRSKTMYSDEIDHRFKKNNIIFKEKQKELEASNEYDVRKVEHMSRDQFYDWVRGDSDKGREL